MILRLVLIAVILVMPRAALAQVDSLVLEREVQEHQGGSTFAESARSLLLQRLRGGDSVAIRSLIAFMDSRRDAGPHLWLSPRERLAAITAIPALDQILDSASLVLLLVAELSQELSAPFDDDLLRDLRSLLRARLSEISTSLEEVHAGERKRILVTLLVNHLLVRSLRARMALNDSIDAFQARNPAAWEPALARRYLRRPYREDPFGIAFHAGYALGSSIGRLGENFRRVHGAVLSVEIYLERVSIATSLLVGVAESNRSLAVQGDFWEAGSASLVAGALAGGYELRSDLLAVTPVVGLSAAALRAPSPAIRAPATGLRVGPAAGAILGYRIPFDVGTHVDLRLRFTWMRPSLSSYDPVFEGSLWFFDIGFALVRRDYAG